MQEHVELEVSLEIIMAEIAKAMFKLSSEKETQKRETREKKLENLICIQENAYKGNRKYIKKILNREFL